MKHYLARLREFSSRSYLFAAKVLHGLVVWISPPRRLVASLLGLAFVISFVSWAAGDSLSGYVLYFPLRSHPEIRAELRDLPRRAGAEQRAELLVSEFLLGPRDPTLAPALPPGSRLESLMLRRGTLYVDLGEDVALVPRPELERSFTALRKTISLGIHEARRVIISIGGHEPWAEAVETSPSVSGKKR